MTGRDKGKQAKVVSVARQLNRVYVKGLNTVIALEVVCVYVFQYQPPDSCSTYEFYLPTENLKE